MLYNQPLAIRFGTELLRHLDQLHGIEPYWDTLDIAVAWVRASGVSHLAPRFQRFLGHGGHLSFVVGIDLQNTTREGLQSLLDLETHGACETFVYHNEAGSIFHPKLYLFRNEEEARLIVGSNNLTESGLFMNVEAGLQLDTDVESGVIDQAVDALSSWKDTSAQLALKLDASLLARLVTGGYVPDEASAHAKVRTSRKPQTTGKPSTPVFGFRRFAPPPKRPSVTPTTGKPTTTKVVPQASLVTAAAPSGTVLLMRLRRASATARRTQTQIPLRLFDSFFKGTAAVRSIHSGQTHNIGVATARGGRNTVKLEVPEMRDFADPVARFEQTPTEMLYEVYDVGTPQGNQIMGSLEEGVTTGATQRSVRDESIATWWRLI